MEEVNKVEAKEISAIEKELHNIGKQLEKISKKGIKRVTIITSIILALVIGLGSGLYFGLHKDELIFRFFPEVYAEKTITILEEKLEDEAKLNTGLYKQSSHFDSGKDYRTIFKKNIPFTKKSLSYDYEGTVEAGIKDLSKTKIEFNEDEGAIIIKLPPIEITNISINSNSISNIKQTNNIFNQVSLSDINDSYKVMEMQLEKDAISKGLIEKAQKSAEKTLTVIFGDTAEKYPIKFVWSK